MSDVKKSRNRIQRAVSRLLNAEVQLSWIGSYTDAEDRALIKEEHKDAKAAYVKALDEVFADEESKP